mgnify:CR=1 FL=1
MVMASSSQEAPQRAGAGAPRVHVRVSVCAGLGESGKVAGGVTVESHLDHRIAMSFAIASLRAQGNILIRNCNNVATSFPGFVALANSVGLKIVEEIR